MSDVFAALADPTRRSVLELLRDEGSMTAGRLAASFPELSRPAVSRHLAILRDAGLARAEARGREVHYALEAAPALREIEAWVRSLTSAWDESLANLKASVESSAT